MPTSFSALIVMVFLLGLRHGFDLDHLATIDAMTRNVDKQGGVARLTGILFSLGHGLIVIFASLLIGSGWFFRQTPQWLEGTGQVVSIFFLLLFSVLTIYNLAKADERPVGHFGLKSQLIKKVLPYSLKPWMVILVGGLFAVSFDTISQVALFSIAASTMSGWLLSAGFGVIFMLGMMVSDGLNGLIVNKILAHTYQRSAFWYQLLSLLIAIFGLVVALMGMVAVLSGA